MKNAPPAGRALDPDPAAVRFDERPGDVEPEAEAAPVVIVDLPEALEDRLVEGRRDARAVVADVEANHRATTLAAVESWTPPPPTEIRMPAVR